MRTLLPLRFCVRLPTSNRVAAPDAIVGVARAAEELGFWAVSVHDHVVFNGAWVACGAPDTTSAGDDRDMYEALTTLAYVAGATSRIRLMTGILLLPIREVVLAAKQIATIDALSGGRMVLGVGIGAASRRGDAAQPMKLGAHAVNAEKENATFRVGPGRGRLANEQLAAMRAIWTEDAPSADGEFVSFDEIEVFPKPAQPGGPPILVGGNSEAAMRRVAALGDGWLPTAMSPAEYAAASARLEELAGSRTRPLRALNIFTAVGGSDAEARELAAATLGERFDPEHLSERNLVGTLSTLSDRIAEYEQAGVELLEFKPVYRSADELIELLRSLAAEVLPRFSGPPQQS